MTFEVPESVRVEIARADALERFASKRVWTLRKRLVEGVELLYSPLWIFDAEIRVENAEGVTLRVAVDGIDATVRVVDRAVHVDEVAQPCLPKLVSREEAQSAFDTEFPVWLARTRSGSMIDSEVRGLVGYPWWVEYSMVGGARTIRALDASNGAWVGARGRAAILRGFVGAARDGG